MVEYDELVKNIVAEEGGYLMLARLNVMEFVPSLPTPLFYLGYNVDAFRSVEVKSGQIRSGSTG